MNDLMRLTVRLGDLPDIETRDCVYEVEDLRSENDTLKACTLERGDVINQQARTIDRLRFWLRTATAALVGVLIVAASLAFTLHRVVNGEPR